MTRIHRVCFLVAAFIGISAATFAQGTRLSQLERIDTVQNNAQNQRYMPITLFNGEVNHLGQTMTIDGQQGYQTTDSIAHHLPLMDWRGDWLATCYEQFDVVVDGCFTMVADTFTCDRPAPQPTGVPYWASGLGDAPAWTVNQVSATEVISGQRYTWIDSAGYLTNARIWVPDVSAGVTYQLVTVIDPLGSNPIVDGSAQISFASTGWNELFIQPRLLGSGVVFDVYCIIRNHASSSTFTWDWDYTTPNPSGSTPDPGEIAHPNQNQSALRVHYFDDGGTNRSGDLGSVKSGDLISGANVEWTVNSVIDQGTYFEFGISPVTQGTPTGVQSFQFTIYGDQLIDYVSITDHYLTQPQIQGVFSITGTGGAVLDQNAYGIDIEVQAATVSDDWSLVAYNCSGAIAGGGSGTADGNGMFDINNDDGTWLVKDWKMTGGNSFATQTSGEYLGMGLTAGNHSIQFSPFNTLGYWINMRDNIGLQFSFSMFNGRGIIASDGFIEFQPQGTNDMLILEGTRAVFGQNIELEEDLIDIGNSPGNNGDVLTSNGIGLGVSWLPGGGGGGALWETDANGIIPIPPVDNIGIGIASSASYSINTGNRVQFASEILNVTTPMFTMTNTGAGDNYTFFNGTSTADDWCIGNDNSVNRFSIANSTALNSSVYFYLAAAGNAAFPFYTSGGIVSGTEVGLFGHTSSGTLTSIPLGSDGEVLTMVGTGDFEWTTPGGGGTDGNGIFDEANDGGVVGGSLSASYDFFVDHVTVNGTGGTRLWTMGIALEPDAGIRDINNSLGSTGDVLTRDATGNAVVWSEPAAALGGLSVDDDDTLTIYGRSFDSLQIDLSRFRAHDSTIVMYQGEESGSINGNIDYPFSMGNGDTHNNNDNYNGWGWHIHSEGRIKRISAGGTGGCTGGATLEIYIDEIATGETLTITGGSTYAKKPVDITVPDGSVVNLKVTSGCSGGGTDWVAYMSVKVAIEDY